MSSWTNGMVEVVHIGSRWSGKTALEGVPITISFRVSPPADIFDDLQTRTRHMKSLSCFPARVGLCAAIEYRLPFRRSGGRNRRRSANIYSGRNWPSFGQSRACPREELAWRGRHRLARLAATPESVRRAGAREYCGRRSW